MRIISRITRRMNSRRTAECVHYQPQVIGDNKFSHACCQPTHELRRQCPTTEPVTGTRPQATSREQPDKSVHAANIGGGTVELPMEAERSGKAANAREVSRSATRACASTGGA